MPTAKSTKRKSEQYYAIHLWDASMPGICSFDKMYIGTEADLKKVAKAMAAGEHYPDTVKAIAAYFEGNREATHNVAYQVIPVLKPVMLKDKRTFTLGRRKWEHLNVWQWPYKMRFAGAEVTQIIVKYEGKYHRCIRAKMKNLCYESADKKYDRLDKMHWGNDFVLEVKFSGKSFTIENLLYVGEIVYASYKEAKADFESDNLIFDGICDEIFGEG